MKIVTTSIPDLLILEPKVFGDDRGFFLESWSRSTFEKLGLDLNFVQDNHSRSARGVIRGLHLQNPRSQGKLVRVTAGRVWDVAVDLRRNSQTFGRWAGVELSAANNRMAWVPPGFAHGFVSLEDDSDFLYKCTAPYEPANEHTLLWDDPAIGIKWPLEGLEPKLSDKDKAGRPLAEMEPFA